MIFDKPLPPPPPTHKRWRIDRIILEDDAAWQELTNDMSNAELEGWTVETLEFHDVRTSQSSETRMMSILVMSREEVKNERET